MDRKNWGNNKRKRKKVYESGQIPKISVIMPCYNVERTIAGAINSILGQTYQNWELVIINDGSTDKTEQEIKKFKDNRIRYYKCPHQGISATRNFGNSKARSKYCIVQDADDYSFPDRLEKVMEKFKEGADIIIHSAYVNVWNEQYQCLERKYMKAQPATVEIIKSQYLSGWPAYKKEVWERRPFREETKYAYDWMMWIDWIMYGFKVDILDEGLYEYVRYVGSASDRFEKEGKRQEAFKIIRRILKDEYGFD